VIEGLPCFDPRTTKGKKKKKPNQNKKEFQAGYKQRIKPALSPV
jgi:hypothetical protein